jgi:hypothetical protein
VTAREALPVGGLEIAGRLRVPRRTVAKWKQRRLLPRARWTVSGEDAWDWWRDIEPWARRTGRLPAQEGEGS